MFKRLELLGTFGVLADNGTFSAALPLRGCLSNICLVTKDSSGDPVAIGTEISSISLDAGSEGSVVQPVAPAVLSYLSLYKKAALAFSAETGITPIYMMPESQDSAKQVIYMIGTKGLSSLAVEIKTGTLSNVASCEVWGERLIGGKWDQMGLGRHMRISKETCVTYGTGEKSFDQMPYRGNRGVRLMAIHSQNAAGTGTVTKSKVEVDNLPESLVPYALRRAMQRIHGRAPQSNFFAIDFARDANQSVGLPLQGLSRVNITEYWSVSPAAAHDYIIETLHGVDEAKGF
jgi:hypothetical protein